MARELLLAQSSDWAFQIYQGTTVQYATKRFQSHIHRFNLLYEMLTTGEVNFELLAEIESRDTIFQEIDYRIYRS
jgi:1,4-alpha-glucan branching enzyme